jgi:hypothetical protein
MKRLIKLLTLQAIVLVTHATLWSQEIIVPAGTIMQCTLEDATLSAKTVAPDDPILCAAGTLRQFGVSVFPRGAYLQGRFAEARDPGHLWGKGWMQLEFDRVIFPGFELPVSTKITSAPRLKVDLEGRIHGTGHARRDVIQWSIPVLWPEKLITLPMRGPRPVLKSEARVTLKLMQDLVIPQEVVARETRPLVMPSAYRSSPAMKDAIVRRASMVSTSGRDQASTEGTILILQDGSVQLVKDYWFDSGQKIQFLSPEGKTGVFPIAALNFDMTVKVNRERGVAFVMRSNDQGQ